MPCPGSGLNAPPCRYPGIPLSKEFLCLAFSIVLFPAHARIPEDCESMNIYVGNLPYSVTDADLRDTFGRFGEVSQVNLITDKFTGESKGFGFVEMANDEEADNAIQKLNGSDVEGRSIRVNVARPKKNGE